MKRIFERTLEYSLVALFVVVIAGVALQVFFRYVLNSPLTWSEELSRLAFTWMLFLGLCLAEKDNIHIAVDFFVDRMPASVQKPLRVAVEVFCIAILLTVVYYSIQFIEMQRAMRSVALDISMAYFTLAVPVGCLLFAIYKFQTIARIMRTDDFRSTPGSDVAIATEEGVN